jgi:hypothetical protein
MAPRSGDVLAHAPDMGLFDSLRNKLSTARTEGGASQQPAAAPSGHPRPVAQAVDPMAVTIQMHDDDDDPPRNYAQEAIDDWSVFDFHNDLRRWFLFELLIERNWEDIARRRSIFAEYGCRGVQHFRQLQATGQRYMQSPAAAGRWGDYGDILQLKGDVSMDMHHHEMQARAQGELAGELAPVEGVALEQWAGAMARIVMGGDLAAILSGLGIDQAKWDRVSAEWNARMSRDTTATIATAYGKAFSSSGQGQYGAAAQSGAAAMTAGGSVDDNPPIPFERYVEIEQAQAALVEQGHDAIAVLQQFGMSVMDWSNVGMWYSQYLARNMNKNGQALYHEYCRLQEKYAAKYRGASSDGDVSF